MDLLRVSKELRAVSLNNPDPKAASDAVLNICARYCGAFLTDDLPVRDEDEYDGGFFVAPVCQDYGKRAFAVFRSDVPFEREHYIMFELATALLTVYYNMDRACHKNESEVRKAVKSAIDSLTYSELESLSAAFKELPETGGIIVTGKIADNMGYARSVIVNGLRKLESAGLIQTRSLGQKGTYIKILNNTLIKMLPEN